MKTPIATERALADLLAGRAGRATATLENHRTVLGGEPWLWSDLGVARAANRETRSPALALLDGLAAVERALELDPAMPEALFNRALFLDELHLVGQASVAWRRYLDGDSSSAWADEARQSLTRLEETEAARWRRDRGLLLAPDTRDETRKELVTRYRQRVRLEIEDRLLPEWGRVWLTGDDEAAARLLRVVAALSRALSDAGGDPMVGRTVAVIQATAEAEDREHLERLARGHREYGTGMSFYDQSEDLTARERFETSATVLEAAGSPFAGWALFRRALCGYYAGENMAVLDEVADLLATYPSGTHPALVGRTSLLQGMASFRLAHLGDAIRSYRAALEAFERIGEREHVAATNFMMAEAWRYHGEYDRSWEHRLRALKLASPLGNAVYYYTTLYDSSQALREVGDFEAALMFQNEMLNWAEATQDDLVTVESLSKRARTYLELGDVLSASADVARGRQLLSRLPEGERRLRMDLALRQVEAESMLGEARATELFSEIIDWANRRSDEFRLPELYELRARALRTQGRDTEAEADLLAAIEASERQAERALDDPSTGAFFDKRALMFRAMVQLKLDMGDLEGAFHFLERGRTRNLRKAFMSHADTSEVGAEEWSHRTASLRDIIEALPRTRTLVVFSALQDEVTAWIVSAEGWEIRVLPLSPEELEQEVEALDEALASGVRFRAASGALFESLWRLILPDLQPFKEVVVVPDGTLHRVPFAALWDTSAQNWTVERWAIITAPSATLYLRALERDAPRGERSPWAALATGAPTLKGTAYGPFSELPHAANEALDIGDIYPSSQVLTGAEATQENVLEAAPAHNVIHLATHAILNHRNPLLSALLLAPFKGQSDGALYAHEIYRLSLPDAALVVLSGCQTGRGRISASEGVDSLARAFLAAGATAVVGTLWPIEDKAARSFAVRLHRKIASGLDPMNALRETQLAVLGESAGLSSRDDLVPPAWAAYQMTGGVATSAASSQ